MRRHPKQRYTLENRPSAVFSVSAPWQWGHGGVGRRGVVVLLTSGPCRGCGTAGRSLRETYGGNDSRNRYSQGSTIARHVRNHRGVDPVNAVLRFFAQSGPYPAPIVWQQLLRRAARLCSRAAKHDVAVAGTRISAGLSDAADGLARSDVSAKWRVAGTDEGQVRRSRWLDSPR
jgi:hypothetical protein